MNLIHIPLPNPVSSIYIAGHHYPPSASNSHTSLEEVDYRSPTPIFNESGRSESSGNGSGNHDYDDDYMSRNKTGDDLRLKTLKHRVLYLEQSLQNVRDDMFKAGFAEAERIYLDRQAQKLTVLRAEFNQLLESLQQEYNSLPDQLDPIITDIIIRSVRNIVGDQLTDPEKANSIVAHQINQCLNRLVDQQEIRITVAPDQHQWLKMDDNLAAFQQSSGSRVILSSDARLKPGECRVESDDFILDGTLDRQLANLRFELSAGQTAGDKSEAPVGKSDHE